MPKAVQISEAKLAANRANAQFSTGPVSEAGKAKVSLNAVKTGLTGHTVLLPTDDVAAYEATIARAVERWQPQSEEERILVQSLADTDWRLQRIPGLEYGIYAMGAEEFAEEFANEPDPAIRCTKIQTKTFLTYHKKLMSLQSQDARLRRHRQQDEERLRKLQGERRYQEAKQQQAREQAEARERAEAREQAEAAAPNGGFEFPVSKRGPRTPINGRSVGSILANAVGDPAISSITANV